VTLTSLSNAISNEAGQNDATVHVNDAFRASTFREGNDPSVAHGHGAGLPSAQH